MGLGDPYNCVKLVSSDTYVLMMETSLSKTCIELLVETSRLNELDTTINAIDMILELTFKYAARYVFLAKTTLAFV